MTSITRETTTLNQDLAWKLFLGALIGAAALGLAFVAMVFFGPHLAFA